MQPKISIITPSFNQGKYLEKTIRSVLEQNYPNLEYIIIDGGSTDNSVDIIKKYEKQLSYWVSEKDNGQSHAINKGMRLATGELLTWLNSDDYLAPGALSAVANIYRTNPNTGAIVGGGDMVDESGEVIVSSMPFEVTTESLFHWIERFFWQPSCFITRKAWEECGPVDEAINFAMDLDLWLKIAAKFPFTPLYTILSSSLKHDDAKTTAFAKLSQIDAALVICRHGGDEQARKFLETLVKDSDAYTAALTEQVANLTNRLDECNKQLTDLNSQLVAKNGVIARLTTSGDVSEHEIHLQRLQAQVDGILNSLSWRITRPLRTLGSVLQMHAQCKPLPSKRSSAPPMHFNLESLTLEDGSEGQVLFMAGWCFSPISPVPVEIEVSAANELISRFVCDLRREDVPQAFPPEATKESSVPLCGFQHYVHLKEGVNDIELKEAATGAILHQQHLPSLKNKKQLRWVAAGSSDISTSHLRAIRQILTKARGVVTRDTIFSLNNWKTWYRCAIDELRWASTSASTLPPNALSPIEAYVEKNRIQPNLTKALQDSVAHFTYQPVLSIVMPVYNVDASLLEEAVASVLDQIYPHWELCIADDASTRPETVAVLKKLTDPRIKITTRSENGHICKASNDAASLATGEFIVLMDNDDLISPNAIFEIVRLLQEHRDADVIYSDEDKIDIKGRHFDLQFKPDWSPTLLLGYNYINHLTCIRRKLFDEVGGFRAGYEGAQDYDLLLRVTERSDRVFHIPKILYHWRAIPGSTALKASEKPIVSSSACRILLEALQRREIDATIYAPEFAKTLNVPVQQLNFTDDGPLVEIIIPTFNQGDVLKTCIESIRTKTTYNNYHITVVDNGSQENRTLQYLKEISSEGIRVERVLNGPEGFSFSRVNNIAVEGTEAEAILFLNNDTEVIEPLWLSRMMGYLHLPGVGATGARLLYPDNTVQHAGVLLGMGGGFIPDHAFAKTPATTPGYFFLPGTSREASAVTGACLLTKRETFLSVGGFDEKHFKVSLNDVDFCLKLEAAGLSILYVAGAELYHHESLTRSRQDDPAELADFREKYGDKIDRFYNPNLSRDCSYHISPKCTLDYGTFFTAKLNVVFFTHNLNHEGAPSIMLSVAEGLQRMGRIHPIVVSPCDGPARSSLEAKGIEVRIVKIRDEANILTSWSSAQELEASTRNTAELLQQLRPDVVVTNVINTFFVVEAAKRCGIPSIWWIHESYDESLMAKNLQSIAYPLAQKAFADAAQIIFVSKGTRDLYNRYNSRLNFNVIHNSLRISDFRVKLHEKSRAKESLACTEKKVIVSVGTVCDRKDQATIVNAAALLAKKRDDFIIYIVGYRAELPYGGFVEREIKEKGVQDFVVLVPETKDVERYYLAADIFAFCSLNESYSLTILEAMAFGLPIVTTECFGISEQVRFGVNALRIGFKDPKGLAEKLEFLLEDDSLRRLYGKNSLEMMRYMQSEEEMLKKHEELILTAFQMKEQVRGNETSAQAIPGE